MKILIRSLMLAGLVLASVSCIAQQPAAGAAKPAQTSSGANASLPSEATVNAFLQKMYGWNQDLKWKVAEVKPSEAPGISEAMVMFSAPQGQQMIRLYVTSDQKYAFTGELVPFGSDPFGKLREELKNVNGPAEGPSDAAVTIVEFGDLQCPACKQAQPNVTKLMQDEPKARLVFENYPLPQHNWAMLGAKYLDCLGRENNAAVWKFIPIVYEHQTEITQENAEQKLKDYVKEAGGDPAATAACSVKPETEKRIADSKVLGEKVNVSSTPTFFIDGRRIVGMANNIPYDAVKAMVEFDMANKGK